MISAEYRAQLLDEKTAAEQGLVEAKVLLGLADSGYDKGRATLKMLSILRDIAVVDYMLEKQD